MKRTARSASADQSLATLCDLLALARKMATEIPPGGEASLVELVEALAASQLSAERLAAERSRGPRRSARV